MRVAIFPENRLILVGSKMLAFSSVKNSLSNKVKNKQFHSVEDLKLASGDEWYRCLKVGIIRNPYDLAVSLHFWYQQEVDPKSMTLATSVRNADWKNVFIDALNSMTVIEYDDVILFENINEDATRIQNVFGFKQKELKPTNRGTRPQETRDDYRTLYDRRTRAIITRLSRKVIDEFGYEF